MAGDGAAAGYVAVVEGWMDWQLDEVVSNLRAVKFDGPDDGRRINMLLKHDLDYSGKSVAELRHNTLDQPVRGVA